MANVSVQEFLVVEIYAFRFSSSQRNQTQDITAFKLNLFTAPQKKK